MNKILLFLLINFLAITACITTNYYGFNMNNFAGAYIMKKMGVCWEIFKNSKSDEESFRELIQWFDEGCNDVCYKINRCTDEDAILIIKGNFKNNIGKEYDKQLLYDIVVYCNKSTYKTTEEAKIKCFGEKSKDLFELTYYEK